MPRRPSSATALARRVGIVLALVLSMLVPAGSAGAADECATDIGTDLPVVLVHGFNSSMSTWDGGPTSVDRLVARSPGMHVQWFDYSDVASQWVTHRRIGPRLADFLACTARVSRDAGGPGKVVVVAHSMGGLATRCALSPSCGRTEGVAEVVDLVITLGTPHAGSFWRPAPVNVLGVGMNAATQAMTSACRSPLGLQAAIRSLCGSLALAAGAADVSGLDERVGPLVDSPAARAFTPGSRELATLPPFPDRVAVHAMAGDIRVVAHLFGPVTHEASVGDGVVGTESATLRHQDGDQASGGTTVNPCGYLDWFLLTVVLPHCNHVTFTQDNTFSAEVVQLIRGYQSSLPRPQPGSFVLGLGGSIGDLGEFAGETEALELVTDALGAPDSDTGWIPPECGPVPGPIWRLVRWGAFELLLSDTPIPQPDGSEGSAPPVPHVAGWTYHPQQLGRVFPQLQTAEGLTLGSRYLDVLDVYPDARETISPFEGGGLEVFRGDFGSLFFDFDGLARVVAMTSGQGGCGDL